MATSQHLTEVLQTNCATREVISVSMTERLTIPALLRRAVVKWGSREAIADGQSGDTVHLTWAELLVHVREFSSVLLRRGVSPGDRVAIWAPNTYHWVISALGAQYIGAVVVPINTRYTASEALDIITRSRARTLVVVGEFLDADRLADLLSLAGSNPTALSDLHTIVQVPYKSEAVSDHAIAWSAFLAQATPTLLVEAENASLAVQPDDIADILFTSGTTGKSKGVLATHDQTVQVGRIWGSVATLGDSDRYLIMSPFFHTFGYKAGYIACLYHGAAIVPLSVFDTETVIGLVEHERISLLAGAPTIFQSILDSPSRIGRDLSSMRVAVTGATTVPIALVERMQMELTFDTVLTAYGLTETSGYVSSTRPGDSPEIVATTCGRPVEGMESKLTSEGELLVRGRLVMLGYLDDPQATVATIDSDGWLHTGDIATIDPQGNIAITDRLKDMYITGGFNVYPAEIEQAVARIPGVTGCAVIGVHDDRLGEVGRAYISVQGGAALSSEEVIARCSATLAKFKVPRYVTIMEALPRNASGKVDKLTLRADAGAAAQA